MDEGVKVTGFVDDNVTIFRVEGAHFGMGFLAGSTKTFVAPGLEIDFGQLGEEFGLAVTNAENGNIIQDLFFRFGPFGSH